jgi:hypothetical protein
MLRPKLLVFVFSVALFFSALPITCASRTVPLLTEPGLMIDLSFSSEHRFPLKTLTLAIVAPDGRTTWQYDAEGSKTVRLLMKEGSVLAENWYTTPGKYSLNVTYFFERPASAAHRASQEFLMTGDERRVTADLWFVEDTQKRRTFLADLTIVRVVPGSSGVWLLQDWTPTSEARPHYQIVNSTDHPIYGLGWRGNFFGSVEYQVNGHSIRYPRGHFCGTVSNGEPIQANGRAGSTEGYFIGDPGPFVNGRYRYVVEYSSVPTTAGIPAELTKKGLTRKRVQEIYEISVEFYIESQVK